MAEQRISSLRGQCPAADLVHRADGLPVCRCRIEHNTMDLRSDPNTILRWCSQEAVNSDRRNGYVQCPTWQLEKDRIELGLHSFGDEQRLEDASAAQWREDLTGSPYGDLSQFEEAAAAAADTITAWQEQHAERLGQ